MKKQNMIALAGKKLGAKEMKKLQGGAITGGLWVCTGDDYRCSKTLSLCRATCSVPSSCVLYSYCP